ncbi:uncharacterized protein LOC135152736 [Daucus carota subsp. sativus]|uniref:uncharacterized protein LOC135152736 n=1 Tax=Daucus carota subsp. sativus TaxID=79200 RepID=UPI003082793B
MCPVCHNDEETIIHSLASCSFARQCWDLLLPRMQWDVAVDFRQWLVCLFNSVSGEKYAEIVVLCWAIWRGRNDLVWNQKSTSVEGDGACVWANPLPNIVKVSVDAAVFGDRGGFAVGLFARDSDGLLVEARAKF